MLFYDGFVLLIDTQVHREQRGAVCKESLGVQHGVLQMVVPHIRLRKRSIDQVIGRGVLTLQKELSGKLIVRLQEVDLGVIQRHGLHIFHKLTVVIVPEDQFSRVSRKLSVEPIYNLFDVHFCHSAFLLLNQHIAGTRHLVSLFSLLVS